MKTTFSLFILLTITFCIQAQNVCVLQLKPNMLITGAREMPPMQKKDAAYFKMDSDERKDADEKFKADVKAGKLSPRIDTVRTTVLEVKQDDAINNYVLSTVSRGVAYKTNWSCINNCVYIYPMQKVVQSEGKTPSGKTVAFTNYYGTNIIPLKLKVGDTLPAYQNYGFSAPMSFEVIVPTTNFYTDVYGATWLVSSQKKVGSTVSSSMIQKFTNREVVAQEEITINNKTYTAFKAHTEIWTKIGVDASTEDLVASVSYRVIKKGVDKKTNKLLGANKEGYLVTSLMEWIVPELGIVKNESYGADGSLVAKVSNYEYN
ncbi:MAG: hypothetical protein H0W61_10945 [Bacteroidetes bacterium]|nr:hypothetical protein [Bacteroidota bacterium]